MRDLNRTLGLTFIFSTHDQRLLEHTPRIIRLIDGCIISDAHSERFEGASCEQVFAASVS
jgi:ABC-type lipoprotein export system ATPase subunit